MKRSRLVLAVVAVVVLAGSVVWLRAQDATKVDAKHYSVLIDNEQVRVLKAHYEPGEKSEMHSHPNAVAVPLMDAKAKFTYPDGKSEDVEMKAGTPMYHAAGAHLPENTGDKAFDVIVIELKGK